MTPAQRRSAFARSRAREVAEVGLVIACGKLCHPSATAAKRAVRRACASGRCEDKGSMGHYYCHRCGAWHIGHSAWRKGANP